MTGFHPKAQNDRIAISDGVAPRHVRDQPQGNQPIALRQEHGPWTGRAACGALSETPVKWAPSRCWDDWGKHNNASKGAFLVLAASEWLQPSARPLRFSHTQTATHRPPPLPPPPPASSSSRPPHSIAQQQQWCVPFIWRRIRGQIFCTTHHQLRCMTSLATTVSLTLFTSLSGQFSGCCGTTRVILRFSCSPVSIELQLSHAHAHTTREQTSGYTVLELR